MDGKYELSDAARRPVEAPDEYNLNLSLASISHQGSQARNGPASHVVGVNTVEVPFALLRRRPESLQLGFRILQRDWDRAMPPDSGCGAADVDRCHGLRSIRWRDPLKEGREYSDRLGGSVALHTLPCGSAGPSGPGGAERFQNRMKVVGAEYTSSRARAGKIRRQAATSLSRGATWAVLHSP